MIPSAFALLDTSWRNSSALCRQKEERNILYPSRRYKHTNRAVLVATLLTFTMTFGIHYLSPQQKKKGFTRHISLKILSVT